MKYATGAAFRAALEERLRRTAAEQGDLALLRLRRLVVFDRLLARLLVVAPDRWVVKGGLALDLRLGDRARTTRDLDLARRDTEEATMADLIAAQAVDLGDFFTFAIRRTGALDVATEGAAVRYHATAALAGRRFEHVIIDIGFGQPILGTPDRLRGSDILGFAGIEPIEVPALPLEQQVAEKLHAYTRTYGQAREKSRVKDLVDLVLIPSTARFGAGRLREAIDLTFTSRNTHAVPVALPSPPATWAVAFTTTCGRSWIQPRPCLRAPTGCRFRRSPPRRYDPR
ncbi:MAG: nucleotidyl transferase AbiEii/AbiGii toxin family protein [Thermomicrobiales bacterium]